MFVMGGVLADGADQPFFFTVGVDTHEVENFPVMQSAFRALEISDSQFFDLVDLYWHSGKIFIW